MYGGMGAQAGQQGMGYGAQAARAGEQYARQATNPYAMQSYMSPYMQNVVDVQTQAAKRQADIAAQTQQAQAARSGAFGGGRDAVMRGHDLRLKERPR